MSEEILKAMMELFALIVKQDGGMHRSETDYVSSYLRRQLPHGSAEKYMNLFLELAGPMQEKGQKSDPPNDSARDSVRIFSLCRRINKTLTQEQRLIALVKCFELVDSDREYTPRRMDIINTIAEVFRVSPDEFSSIWSFVREERKEALTDPSVTVFTLPGEGSAAGEDPFLAFLRVGSVNLYFVKGFHAGKAVINGMPLENSRIYTFAPGSWVRIPPSMSVYYADVTARFSSASGSGRLSFVAEKLRYVFPDGTVAVNDLSFTATEGQFIGIMGASGTGKTTLLNLLSGLISPPEGDVRINGISVSAKNRVNNGVVGYVPQDDMLLEDLTVRENLWYAASFCLGDRSDKEREEAVDQTLKMLGLYEKKDLRVGSPLNNIISGGQRKRLNIALELIRQPSVLFLDEPTSGLSSRDSGNVTDLLRDLTLRGKLVITVIHQPSSEIFRRFDRILVLDHDGQMIWYGNPLDAMTHFRTLDGQVNSDQGECPVCGNVDPETIFDIIEARVVDEYGRYTEKRRVSPDEWAEVYRCRKPLPGPAEVTAPAASSLKRPSWLRQTMLFLTRDIRVKTANRQYLALAFAEGPLLGLVLSYIIRYVSDPATGIYVFRENENIPIYIFMSIIVALFLGLTLSAGEIFRDRKLLRREHFLSLSHSAYLASKITVVTSILALQVLLFLLPANAILGIKGMTGWYWAALFATALCAGMTGLNISSAFNSATTIYIVIPVIMIPMMVLSGAMFPFDKLNRKIGSVDKVPLVAELMPSRWSYEALMVKQATGNEYDRRVYALRQQISNADFTTVYRIPAVIRTAGLLTESLKEGGAVGRHSGDMHLLANEIRALSVLGATVPFAASDSLTPALFTQKTGEGAVRWLNQLSDSLSARANTADAALDRYVREHREQLAVLYDGYHNDKLEETVRKVYEKNKIIEYRNRLVQNVDLVFLEPPAEIPFSIRTHFMAPVKYFAGRKTDTFVFNMGVMLLAAAMLAVVLYFDLLRRLVGYLEKIFRPSSVRKNVTVNNSK